MWSSQINLKQSGNSGSRTNQNEENNKTDSRRKKVKITGKVFRGNFTIANLISSHPKTTLGLSTFYWVLIGAVSGGIIIIATISGVCGYKLEKQLNEAGGNTSTAGKNKRTRRSTDTGRAISSGG